MNDAPDSDAGPAHAGPLLAPPTVHDGPPSSPKAPTPSPGSAPKPPPALPQTPPLPSLGQGQNITTLLKRTGIDGDFVMYGKLRVEVGIAGDFEKAQHYLAKDPEAVKMLGMLVDGDTEHRIHKTDASDPIGDRFEANQSPVFGNQPGGDIFWNPTGGLRSVAGVTSPALALLHEEGHAWECKSDTKQFDIGIATPNARYTDNEEQRNERTTEAHAARILGEPIRTDHYGSVDTVSGPTSRDSVAPHVHYQVDQTLATINASAAFYKTLGYPTPDRAESVEMWDRKKHTGTFIAIDDRTVALSTGVGKYQLLDVKDDLHGVYPRQLSNSEVDARGHVHVLEQGRERHAQLHVFANGKTETLGIGFKQHGMIVDMDADRVVQSVRNEDGTTRFVTFSRRELEENLPKGQHLDKSVLHKNVDISIGRDGLAHLDVATPPRHELPEHDRVRTKSIGQER